jgi:hypothetical protein
MPRFAMAAMTPKAVVVSCVARSVRPAAMAAAPMLLVAAVVSVAAMEFTASMPMVSVAAVFL